MEQRAPQGDEIPLWERLQACNKPVILYGMGDGADKILTVCRRCGIPIAGVFASEEFVRGQTYQGFVVERLEQVEARLGKHRGAFSILLCFASHRPEVLAQIDALGRRHELYAPDMPVFGDQLFDSAFVARHRAELCAARELLADSQSRRVFDAVVRHKLTGEIPCLRTVETPKDEGWSLLRPGREVHYVDAGAYTGDTVAQLLTHTGGRFGSILALEPDRRNFRRLSHNLAQLDPRRLRLVHAGAWDALGDGQFLHRSGRHAALEESVLPGTKGGQIPPSGTVVLESLDRLLEGRPCTLIKYDVEGAEARALRGSTATIRQQRPALLVSCYHRSEDLFALPLLLRELCPGYRIHLRKHPCLPAWDVNLYAVPEERAQ